MMTMMMIVIYNDYRRVVTSPTACKWSLGRFLMCLRKEGDEPELNDDGFAGHGRSVGQKRGVSFQKQVDGKGVCHRECIRPVTQHGTGRGGQP